MGVAIMGVVFKKGPGNNSVMKSHSYLEGATPTKVGPRPLNSADGPSFWMIYLKYSKYNI